MLKKRLIAVLIIRDGRVVQSVQFKHTNSIHYDPVHAIECFNKWAVDEIVILNVSREASSRDHFAETVKRISQKCFVPLSVGGWITDMDYGIRLLQSGADKLVVNTILADDPKLVQKMSKWLGKQCIVASMDIQRDKKEKATIRVDRGQRSIHHSPAEWAKRAEKLGAGEIFFNSIDCDGNRQGYDLKELKKVCAAVEIPVIAFGGVFRWQHLVEGIHAGADAVGVANLFHYTEHATVKAKRHMAEAGIHVRSEGQGF
ncbi:MAG: imidazole glycerol phosphate synthase subunit HisF [Verrucomicrobiota bacterium]